MLAWEVGMKARLSGLSLQVVEINLCISSDVFEKEQRQCLPGVESEAPRTLAGTG